MEYGQRRFGEMGRPLDLRDGQRLERIDFRLPRMGVVTGRITDKFGEPLSNVAVFRLQSRYFRTKRQLVPVGGFVRSDDTGQYRMLNVEPGDYFVMGSTRETWPAEDGSTQQVGFLPTYFGGTTSPADAQSVKVALGQEVLGIDFVMIPGHLAIVSGIAITSTGIPLAGENVSLEQQFEGPRGTSTFGASGARVSPDGSFKLDGVVPGLYKLTLRTLGGKDQPAQGASVTINVVGDVEGVMLVPAAPGTIAGQVVTDTSAAPPFTGVKRLRVSARPQDPANTYTYYPEDNGRVKDDGSFEVTDVVGVQRLDIAGLPSGWGVRSINYEGRDLADDAIEVRPGQRIEGVTVVLSDKLARAHGQALDERLRPADSTVILFPCDESRRGENSRRVRAVRPDQNGAFEIPLVPPGDYFVIAVDYVHDGDWLDPEYLKRIQPGAKQLRLQDGDNEAIALTVKSSVSP